MFGTFRLLLFVALLATGCSDGREVREVHGTLERDRLELIAESDEPVAWIAVQEGMHVDTGAVLLQQVPGAMQAQLDQARASLAGAERHLADLVAGPRQREIAAARAALAGAQSAHATALREFERIDALVERRLLSASDRDEARARRDTTQAGRDEAQARLELLLEGTRPEQVRQSEAAVAGARAELARLEVSAARYVVTAPRPGLIEALPYERGERPRAGAAVVIMLADGAPYARVYVPEPLRTRFAAGTRVSVSIDGVPGALEGVVRFVSAQAAFTPFFALTQKDRTRLSYLAEIVVDDPRAAAIPVGMPVQVAVPGPTVQSP